MEPRGPGCNHGRVDDAMGLKGSNNFGEGERWGGDSGDVCTIRLAEGGQVPQGITTVGGVGGSSTAIEDKSIDQETVL